MFHAICRPGGDLLSRVLRRSTIGAGAFHGRVRNGIGCFPPRHDHQVGEAHEVEKLVRHFAEGDNDGTRKHPCQARCVRRRRAVAGATRDLLFAIGFIDLWSMRWSLANENDQADRAISTGKLHTLLRFHTRPINVVVFHGSQGTPGIEGGFPLRCFQRLSLPYLATQLCRWRDNWSTRGTSTPVLSY